MGARYTRYGFTAKRCGCEVGAEYVFLCQFHEGMALGLEMAGGAAAGARRVLSGE